VGGKPGEKAGQESEGYGEGDLGGRKVVGEEVEIN